MGLFGSKQQPRVITDTVYSWKDNVVEITADGYLKSSGVININRIPIRHIDTIAYFIDPLKPSLSAQLKIIGKGVVLGHLSVGLDVLDELQDWLLEKLNL